MWSEIATWQEQLNLRPDLSAKTIALYTQDARRFATWLQKEHAGLKATEVTSTDAKIYRDHLLAKRYAPNGKQKYRCHTCGHRSRENPTPNTYPEARREEILHASARTQQLTRPHAHLWGLTRHRVQLDQKKVAQLPPLRTTLVAPNPEDPTSTILELDELWSFVLKKAHDSWIWIALCRKTRQVVAYAVGARNKKTCQRLWEAIPQEYRQGHCFTDFLRVYASVIPQEQHTAVGKETGETAHVERWNNTLRQRLARFVRMTLSFSKSVVMHEACLLLFLSRYNLERAILLK